MRFRNSFVNLEQGNWNKHSDQDSRPSVDWAPPVDSVNAYTAWPTRVDYDHDGTIESDEKETSLSLSYDAARAFLYEREESQGQYLLYRHDALGRLSTISRRLNGTDTELVRYGYTADGRLAYRNQTTPSEELYLISDGDHVIIERTASATQRTFTWAGATLLKSRDTGGVELHLYQDRLGSVVLATKRESGSTSMHGRAQYDPYGNNISNGAWSGNGVGQPYGYTGARWDYLAGLYLMGARWYAPEMGRFVELDPIGEGGGWNLYNYVGSSPTMWVDPSGLRPEGAGRFTGFAPSAPGGGFRQISGISINGDTRSFLAKYGAGESLGAPGHAIGTGAIPCPLCSEEKDKDVSDEKTAETQQAGATDPPGIGITPADGEDPRVVGEFESQIEQAIGLPITKGEDGRYRRGQGPVTEKKQAALDAFDNAARMGTNFKTASRTPDGKVDDFDSQTVYVDTLAGFPTDEQAKDIHAITQEETVTHILAEYTEGTRRGAFTEEVYKSGAHDLGVQAQNDYRKANGREKITASEARPHGVINLLRYGEGMTYTYSYADGTRADFHVWTGGTAFPSGWR